MQSYGRERGGSFNYMHEMMTWGTQKQKEGVSSCHGIPWIEEGVAEAAFKLWNMECGCGINHSPFYLLLSFNILLLSNHLYFCFFLFKRLISHSMKRREGEEEGEKNVICM